jgi:uncharacterized membrane protein
MKRVELFIDIDGEAEDIWTVLTDPAAFPEWIQGMQQVEVLTEGEYGVGTRYRAAAGSGERTIEWTVEVTAVVPEKSIDFSYTGAVEGNGGWRIEELEDDEGCRVTSFDEFAPPGGWLVKLLSKLWFDNANRAARMESLERLKERVESEYEYVYEDEDEDEDQDE